MNRTVKLVSLFIVITALLAAVPALLSLRVAGSDHSGNQAGALSDSPSYNSGNSGLASTGNTDGNNTDGSNTDGSNTGDSKGNSDDRIKNAIVMYVGSTVAYVNGSRAQIDPADPEVAPVMKNGARMVPVRFIAESLGAKVDWDQKSRTAAVTLDGEVYQFTQGSDVMMAGKTAHKLEVPVQTVKGRTFVPLEKFAEVLGKKAFFDRGLIVISEDADEFDPVRDKELISSLISRMSYLPVVGTYEKLMELLKDAEGTQVVKLDEGVEVFFSDGVRAAKAEAESSVKAKVTGTTAQTASDVADHSTTNVQVQGVDEADVVKTDGKYIYQVNRQRVVVAKAYPGEELKVLSILKFEDESFSPQEIYLHNDKLVVIGMSTGKIPVAVERKDTPVQKETTAKRLIPPYIRQLVTKTLVFDISDKQNIRLLREVELEGSYVSSRKIGSSLYIIANRYIYYYHIMDSESNATPFWRDTLVSGEYISVGYDSIYYFPGVPENNYMMVAGIDLDGNEAADINTYLGAGQNIYASPENLYVTVTGYKTREVKQQITIPENSSSAPIVEIKIPERIPEENTVIYKFGLKDGKTTYLCRGEVPGRILNQFSMDEDKGYFRIATTTGEEWRNDERTSKNNLYILDDVLSITGKIEGIAPGERIYSVRFMGDRAYMVTFKTVDPLFVLDLRDPKNPTVLGALKIPGYSDYLHPYDENHIIGFGKDTMEIKGQAYYLGMKIALFDISDVSNPVQKFSETIGDRGTESELLQNHKALLFSREKNLLAFPVTVMEVKDASGKVGNDWPQYGQFSFQGAYIYSLDAENGFQLRGRITHLSDEDFQKAGGGWYESDKNVRRILYIGDTLYTLSNSMIKAHGLADLKEKGSVVIP